MSMDSFPRIRFEVEGLRMSITAALLEHHGDLGRLIEASVAENCTPERLVALIDRQAVQAIEQATREALDAYFRLGEGRKAVKAAVARRLAAGEP